MAFMEPWPGTCTRTYLRVFRSVLVNNNQHVLHWIRGQVSIYVHEYLLGCLSKAAD
ncbi:hypothetical protein HPP92_003284 [Vanilla planifolia]|uniref:Uncharacterized protein n=1 Tax=Vanilla planifolia TaxID=51239 RepID=A0A835VFP6_VANPL|nr:hypothetical protein HPP92_003675 [Vanilla planifolia]KAG0503212.1 hypothetical protein HPP92_003284 [Vanilla planifolia]